MKLQTIALLIMVTVLVYYCLTLVSDLGVN